MRATTQGIYERKNILLEEAEFAVGFANNRERLYTEQNIQKKQKGLL